MKKNKCYVLIFIVIIVVSVIGIIIIMNNNKKPIISEFFCGRYGKKYIYSYELDIYSDGNCKVVVQSRQSKNKKIKFKIDESEIDKLKEKIEQSGIRDIQNTIKVNSEMQSSYIHLNYGDKGFFGIAKDGYESNKNDYEKEDLKNYDETFKIISNVIPSEKKYELECFIKANCNREL